MCNCIEEMEEKAFEMLKKEPKFNKPVINVQLLGISFPIMNNKVSTRTVNMLEIELEGQKKKPQMSMMHTFCPFCGIKYESKERECKNN